MKRTGRRIMLAAIGGAVTRSVIESEFASRGVKAGCYDERG